MILTVDIPLPPKELKPNVRSHYHAKSDAKNRFKGEVAFWARRADQNRCSKLHEVTIQAHFRFRKKNRRDPDNLLASLKYAFDGLVAADVLIDDDKITHLPVTVEISPDNPGVTLTISSKDAE